MVGLQTASPAWAAELPRAFAPTLLAARDREPSTAAVLPAGPRSLPASLPDSLEAWESEFCHSRCEPDLRLRPLGPIPVPVAVFAPLQAESLPSTVEEEREKPTLGFIEERWRVDDEALEPAQPLHANLIEFPRELVAARKMRPRRAEGPFAVEAPEKQLKIFEVDPGDFYAGPEPDEAARDSAWPEPDWSGIELEAQAPEAPAQEEPAPRLAPELAPVGRRLWRHW